MPFGKGGVTMQQCPFCGTQWNGSGPCPGCGLESKTPRDDAMFRPPEKENSGEKESLPEFKVEELLHWEPSQNVSSEAGEEAAREEQAPVIPEKSEEEPRVLKKPWKRWQKLTIAVVAVVVAVALVVRLWPQTPVLPQTPAFFVQDDTLMALPVNGDPQKITEYAPDIEDSLQVGPDQKSIAWSEPGVSVVKFLPAEGEEAKVWDKRAADSPRFSQDGKYLYFCMENEETGDPALWQYEIASGKERMIGPLYWNYFLENGTLLAVYDGTNLTVYEVDTGEEKWSLEDDVRWMKFSDDRLYFAQAGKEAAQLCCWQDGQVEVLLEDLECLYTREDGEVYIQCYQDDLVPAADMVKNDIDNADGHELMGLLEDMEIHSPGRTLYFFDGEELHPLGENQRLYVLSYINRGAAICSMEYPSVEEAKGTLSLNKLYDLWVEQGRILQSQVEALWPYEASLDYVAVEGKLFHLPEDVPQTPYRMQIEGDWICLDVQEENIIWLGKIEGESVVSQNTFAFQETMNFHVTSEGNLYYWSTSSMGPLFENGIPIATQAHLQSLQCTEDGAVYFLEGNSAFAFTLNRVYEGKKEEVAEKVKKFTAYTRDYVTYLQYWEDEENQDLFTYTAGKRPVLVAEGVADLLPAIQQDTPEFDVELAMSYKGPEGYIDMDSWLATWMEELQ